MFNADNLLASYNFYLPESSIAQIPANERDKSKLMQVDNKGNIEEYLFSDVVGLLKKGDLIVRNNTKVLPARLFAKKKTGGKIELLLVRKIEEDFKEQWICLAKPAAKIQPEDSLSFENNDLIVRVVDKLQSGEVIVEFSKKGQEFRNALSKIGQIPLPPYISREGGVLNSMDIDRYQTLYAKKEGAVAAPTAGLHFTKQVEEKLLEKGIEIAELTLHVGPGTFRPIKVEEIDKHVLDPEWFCIEEEAARKINKAKDNKQRIIAVGTTTTRTLEYVATKYNKISPTEGWSDIFIKPGYKFKVVDGLITNFHLPESSLLVLVSAMIGRENIINAYKKAVENKYRFYSYGDAMLLWR